LCSSPARYIAEPVISMARRQQLLDGIMREAADIVLAIIKKSNDADALPVHEHQMNVPFANLPCSFNFLQIARLFKKRLQDLHSNERALSQRLHKWKKRGIDQDPVAARGRPRSGGDLVKSTLLANRAQGHIGPKAAIHAAVSKKRQKNVFQSMSEEISFIEGCGRQPFRNRCGRPVDSEFERAVVERVDCRVLYERQIFLKLSDSLQAVVVAGREIAQELPFCNSKIVQMLEFSTCWAVGVLRRARTRRNKAPQSAHYGPSRQNYQTVHMLASSHEIATQISRLD
jgi:hypothetical protein